MKIIYFIAVFIISFFLNTRAVEAKLLPRFQKVTGVKAKVSYSSSPTVSVRLRGDRKALNLNIGNLRTASSVSYTLSYQTNGKDEGVAGTIDPAGQASIAREILFGTCSSGVCRYHTGITNAKLEIISSLNSGKRVIKRFRIRV